MPWAVLPCTISSSIKIAPPPLSPALLRRSIVACQQLLCLIYAPTWTQVNPIKRSTMQRPHAARCIRINGRHFVPTHTHTHTDAPLVCVGVCVYDICIKYKHYYLCFAIDSCQSIFVACPDDVDIVALLLLPNCPCRHSRTRCYIE